MKRQVVVDVYNWIAVSANRPEITMRGIYRHAYALAKEFQPAYYLTPEESANLPAGFNDAHCQLERELGKRIFRFEKVDLIGEYAKVWVSIGLDNVSPVLPLLKQHGVLRVSVLHDTMSFRKVFGPQCEANFKFGNEHHDLLLPVSKFAWEDYQSLELQGLPVIKNRVAYGCFHHAEALPSTSLPYAFISGSVSTIEPRKRIVATVQTALNFSFAFHHHIGAYDECENPKEFERLLATGRFIWHKKCGDEEMQKILQRCTAFFCLSSDEGFSMTPLEAILVGVPYIFLSDIPVHREIYGRCNVNFLRIGEHLSSYAISEYKQVSHVDRTELFNAWKWETVIQPFKTFTANLQ